MAQFIDQVRIKVRSGDGGNGMIAWRREKYEPLGGPAGGTGGRGGDVILEATNDLSTLLDFHYKNEFLASNGEKGGPKNRSGKAGQHLVIRVPVGTIVSDAHDGNGPVADLTKDGARVMVAEGGRGGRGNAALSTHGLRAPHFCEPGELGIERDLQLTLKLIADVGFVGLPNAGKSSMLAALTAARPKIADYPFSTLSPNLGVMRRPDGDGVVLADIPGLIEGASQGLGLGHTFLRHVERTRLLIHVADITQESLKKDLQIITQELQTYAESLASARRLIFLNKADLLLDEERDEIKADVETHLADFYSASDAVIKVLAGSCATGASMDELRNLILEHSIKPEQEEPLFLMEDLRAVSHPGDRFEVTRRKHIFYVAGPRVEKMVDVTDLRNPESCQHLYHVLRSMGVIDALMAEGVETGSEIVIGKTSFSYGEDW